MALDKYKGIINGDCDTVLQKMVDDGVKYDLILTDPPYNVGKDFGNTSDKLPLVGLEYMIIFATYKFICIKLVCFTVG